MSACSWYEGGHNWDYEKIRTVNMFRATTLGGVEIGERVTFSIEKQRRTCEKCGVTQDKKVGDY